MRYFDILTILCVGLMIGNELTVSAFINPVLQQLDERAHSKALSLFAKLLGKVMPFWYGLSLLLILAEACLHRHSPALASLLASACLWVAIIVYSITVLVPINNRLTLLESGTPTAGWQQQQRRWETLHRWRIVSLIVSMVFLLHGILQPIH